MTIRETLSAHLRLLRPYQWYKNLLVFVPLIFVGDLLQLPLLVQAILAFIGLCLVSSAGYVFNDMVDAEQDRKNPEKSDRPLVSGRLSKKAAVISMMLALLAGSAILLYAAFSAFLIGLVIFALTTLYTIYLKREPVLDVLVVGVNFVLRAAVGAFTVGVAISPWLVICALFLAILLALGKRLSEQKYLGSALYAPEDLRLLMNISTTMLLMSYTLYTFLSGKRLLVITLPLAIYAVMRYYLLALSGARAARHPHLLLLDVRMIAAIVLWVALTVAILYALPQTGQSLVGWMTPGFSAP